jgi:hypothetical protein
MISAQLAALLGLTTRVPPRHWPPEARAPLPPLDHSGNPVTTLPTNLNRPDHPDRLFWRGNAWSVTIPGLPFVPGGSSEQPERCLTWFYDRWDASWRAKIREAYAARGYTHFVLSWPDSRSQGVTVDQFVALALELTDAGFFVHVMLGSKDYDPHDQTWTQLEPLMAPVLRALIAAKAVSSVALWETDLWNIPGAPLQTILDGIANIAVPADVHQWVHFSTERTSWFVDGGNRRSWWQRQNLTLVGILYQDDVNWDMGTRQARLADTQNQFGEPNQQCWLTADGKFRLVAWEMDAAAQFSNPQPDENQSDMRGYLAVCSPGAVAVAGYGNGARMIDGSVL